MSARKYFGRWSGHAEVGRDWGNWDWESGKDAIPENFPTDDEILFASYGGGAYDGDAFVLFERAGTLYEASGSHCSCYGLEGQWKPDETTWEALAMRQRSKGEEYFYGFLYDHDYDARTGYWALVDAHVPVQAQIDSTSKA
jgi:hypothetical protein